MSTGTAYEACPCQHCRGQLWSKGEMSATYSNAFYEGLRPGSTPGDYGFGGEDSLNLPLMDPSLEAYLLQKDEESDEAYRIRLEHNMNIELERKRLDQQMETIEMEQSKIEEQ